MEEHKETNIAQDILEKLEETTITKPPGRWALILLDISQSLLHLPNRERTNIKPNYTKKNFNSTNRVQEY